MIISSLLRLFRTALPLLLLATSCLGMTLTQTSTFEFDVIASDGVSVVCSSAVSDCSAYRPLFKFDFFLAPDDVPTYHDPSGIPRVDFVQSPESNLLVFILTSEYEIINLSEDYGFRISRTFNNQASGLFQLRGRSGPSEITWGYDKNFSGSGLDGYEIPEISVNLFPTEYTGCCGGPYEVTRTEPFNEPFPIVFSASARFTDYLVPRNGLVFGGLSYSISIAAGANSDNGFISDETIRLEEVLPVPEPATNVLIAVGFAFLGWRKLLSRSPATPGYKKS